MKQRHIWATAIAMALASPAYANPHVDRIISQLQAEGFQSFETERTWLGRIRIEAEKGNLEREIVLNRSTGEILRDYISVDDKFFPDDETEDEEHEGEQEEEGEDHGDDEGEEDDDEEDEDDEDDEDDDEEDDE